MEKPVLATNIDGLLIAHEAFVEPHKAWFDRAIKKTKDYSLEKWKGQENYWPGVVQAMKLMMPEATEEEKNRQARKWYQEDVIKYIREHQKLVNRDIVKKLIKKKSDYRLTLITTSTEDHIDRILKAAKIDGMYDIIIASQTNREPKKLDLFNRLIKEYEKPKYYLTQKSEPEVEEFLKQKGIKIISLKDLGEI